MDDRIILCLPPEAELLRCDDLGAVRVPYWARMMGGKIVERGQGNDWAGQLVDLPLILALAPATDAPVRFVQINLASPAQAAATARVEAISQILGDKAEAHIAAGSPAEIGETFPLCTTRHSAMKSWQDWLAAKGWKAEAIVPAAAIMPPPDGAGLVAFELAGQQMMRSASHGYASDPAVDDLLADGGNVRRLEPAEWEASLALAAQHIPVNLASGAWKPKQNWVVDAQVFRWVKILAAALVLLSLAALLVQGLKLKMDIGRADDQIVTAAAQLGLQADDAASAEAMIDQQLAAQAGGPLAFSVPASALYAALAEAPAVTLKSLSHRSDGTLTAMIAAPRVEDLNPVLLALQARGYRITAQPLAGNDGLQMANLTIRAVP